jgi:drug/metabolite transporter (DMT)-like permease
LLTQQVFGSNAKPAPAPSTRKAFNEAARTSTYYAFAPLIGAALSFLLIGEPLTPLFLVATAVMAAGCWLAAKNDT